MWVEVVISFVFSIVLRVFVHVFNKCRMVVMRSYACLSMLPIFVTVFGFVFSFFFFDLFCFVVEERFSCPIFFWKFDDLS